MGDVKRYDAIFNSSLFFVAINVLKSNISSKEKRLLEVAAKR